jgi:hypothetical protein
MYSSVQRPYVRKWAYAWSQTADVSSISVDAVPFDEYFFDRLATLNVRYAMEATLGSFAEQELPASASSIPVSFRYYDPYKFPSGGYWRWVSYEPYGGEITVTGGNSDGSWAGLIAGMRNINSYWGFVLDVKTSAGLEVDLSQMQFQLAMNLYSSYGTRVLSGAYDYTGSALTGNGQALLERATMSPRDLATIVYLRPVGPA